MNLLAAWVTLKTEIPQTEVNHLPRRVLTVQNVDFVQCHVPSKHAPWLRVVKPFPASRGVASRRPQ